MHRDGHAAAAGRHRASRRDASVPLYRAQAFDGVDNAAILP